MKTEGMMVLHYGLDYLPYAIKSVYDHVDRFHVVYSPHPGRGVDRAGGSVPGALGVGEVGGEWG